MTYGSTVSLSLKNKEKEKNQKKNQKKIETNGNLITINNL